MLRGVKDWETFVRFYRRFRIWCEHEGISDILILKALNGEFSNIEEAKDFATAWAYWFQHTLSPEEKEEYVGCLKQQEKVEIKEGENEVDFSNDD